MNIDVLFYAGYKGKETPRALVVSGTEYPVERVLSRRRCQDKESGDRFDLFHCLVNGRKVLIKHDESGTTEILRSSDLSFLST